MLRAGDRVGDYEVEKRLGAGTIAHVYRVRDRVLDGQFAMKVLDDKLRASPEVRRRFLGEARAQAVLGDHPGIVRAINAVATPDVAALISNLVDGPTLGLVMERRRELPDAAQLRSLMLPIVQAVGAAHKRGVVHRGLKPANVIFARGPGGAVAPRVTDFGLAKITDGVEPSAARSSIRSVARRGRLNYMSPEQIRSPLVVAPSSDIFALGVIGYEIATGVVPFAGENEERTTRRILRGTHLHLRDRRADLPVRLCDAIERAMSLASEDRFESCDALAKALGGTSRSLGWRS